ncbi:serine/threonine-protein phosphatase T [[Candida] jaroonii]|uniref:Serine/threonine-protein phosphatase T n=1 Tax=[Candida] jaroonii TaxID=467808 RepID=A0ACA9Y313_9ASCO|nr:serine/threonine-protein phosphatase T [[Candida] jaroonii]
MDAKEQAIKLKDQGNKCLKELKFDDAIDCYTKAIELDDQNAVFYSNRAQVHIKLENYGLAIADCDNALKVDPNMMKAYYRKGVSLMAILNYKEAQKNFKIILAKIPNDKLTLENYKQTVSYLKKQAFERAIAGDAKELLINSINYESILIEKTWEGPELTIQSKKTDDGLDINIQGLDEEYLKYMIKLFKDGGRLPKKHVFAIISKVYTLLKKESTMTELIIPHSKINPQDYDNYSTDALVLGEAKKITVVGDTHGQFYDVLNLFKRFGKVSKDHIYLFNGDFVDRGSWSCEVALYLYVLKVLYPQSIFINRGNHETNDMNKTYGFTDECEHKYSKKIFDVFAESFGALPYASLINGSYLIMHGGLFSDDHVKLNDIKQLNRFPSSGSTQPPRDGIAMELLWTDPQNVNGRAPSKRGIGMQFGPDITERFCLSNKIRKVLRSHEVRMDGVEEEHNGRLITVFSAPNYCDATGNKGGVVHITENTQYNPENDDGEGFRNPDVNCPWDLDIQTFEAVPHPDIKPMAYSKSGFGF